MYRKLSAEHIIIVDPYILLHFNGNVFTLVHIQLNYYTYTTLRGMLQNTINVSMYGV